MTSVDADPIEAARTRQLARRERARRLAEIDARIAELRLVAGPIRAPGALIEIADLEYERRRLGR